MDKDSIISKAFLQFQLLEIAAEKIRNMDSYLKMQSWFLRLYHPVDMNTQPGNGYFFYPFPTHELFSSCKTFPGVPQKPQTSPRVHDPPALMPLLHFVLSKSLNLGSLQQQFPQGLQETQIAPGIPPEPGQSLSQAWQGPAPKHPCLLMLHTNPLPCKSIFWGPGQNQVPRSINQHAENVGNNSLFFFLLYVNFAASVELRFQVRARTWVHPLMQSHAAIFIVPSGQTSPRALPTPLPSPYLHRSLPGEGSGQTPRIHW